jgi:hypothetical protein
LVTREAPGFFAICDGHPFSALQRDFQSDERFYIVFSERLQSCYNLCAAIRDQLEKMTNQKKEEQGSQGAGEPSSPGTETERFRIIFDARHNEAVTAESGVPLHERDHELRRQMRSLEEFS